MRDHEVEVGGQVADKLDDGRLVVLVVQRQGEGQPEGRDEEEGGQEEEELVARPVADAALPQLRGVRLDGRVGNDGQM